MKKNPSNIILIVGIIVILLVTVEYFTLMNRPPTPVVGSPNTGNPELNSTPVQHSEPEMISNLKTNWQSVQSLIPLRPVYRDKAENSNGIWQTPYIVQFIGKGNMILEVEDDSHAYVVVLHAEGDQFTLLELFKNQHNFALSEYQNLLNKYGDSSHPASTYTIGLVRSGKIISFQDLTKVSENIFVKGYSTAGNY